ncbi:hypothetical protein ACEWY4_014647 [Coilia grayii]|uniref:Leucine-rich repeat and IQ domain-containing protein 3 n=1 Tax=Coilia grayii TaxID=363190 RepID=A0ABD1JSW9_9TELE
MDVLDAQQFLISCTASLILHHGVVEKEGKEPTLQEIVMVKLGSHMLKNVAFFEGCLSLRICILSGNFITNIAALSECVHLIKLDLSGNQIKKLPDVDYWRRFKELLLLNLHDNNMSTRKHVIGLSGCPNLTALTLHDTPLSLKENYRHCIVNSLWSLKALDKYVISDEEIIEGFSLPPKFKQKTPNLAVDLHPASIMETFKDEMMLVMQIMSKINQIQAIYSPTLIIQRWIRGHLVRKSLGARQRWRKVPKQLSPIMSKATTDEDHPNPDEQPALAISVADKHTDVSLLTTGHKYTSTSVLMQVACEERKKIWEKHRKAFCPPFNTPQHSEILSLGKTKDEGDEDVQDISNELQNLALEMTDINLFGYKAALHRADPIINMLLSRRQEGRDVRRDISYLHSQKPSPKKPPHPRLPMVTAEQRLLDRCHAGVDFKVFRTIERGNRARECAIAHRKRAEQVVHAQARREEAKEYRVMFMESRRKEALLRREHEQSELQQALLRLKASQNQCVQHARVRYVQYLETRKLHHEEQAKVDNFCSRHLSLQKVIARQHARHKKNIILQEKQSLVTARREHAAMQRKLIQDYLERR